MIDFDWMIPIILRNIIGTLVICGFWEWFLYFSPMRNKMKKYKITKEYPTTRQMLYDMYFTLQAAAIAGLIECGMCYCWANNIVSFQRDMTEKPFWNILGGLMVKICQKINFAHISKLIKKFKISKLIKKNQN